MKNLPPLPELAPPAPFQVWCCVWLDSLSDWHWHRAAAARTLVDAIKAIDADAAAMVRKDGDVRVYRIFYCGGFEQLGADDTRP